MELLDTRKDAITNRFSPNILFSKEGLSNDDVGVARGSEFQEEVRSGAGFKTGDFFQETLERRELQVPYNDSCGPPQMGGA